MIKVDPQSDFVLICRASGPKSYEQPPTTKKYEYINILYTGAKGKYDGLYVFPKIFLDQSL